MPICPFCRKPVEPGSVWCSCGANLSRYPTLPVNSKEIKDWLAEHEPEFLASSWSGGSLLDAARKRLISEQEEEITANTRTSAEVAEAKNLIENFFLACRREGLAPTIDIGQLRRDRWRQWKRIPTEYRQHPPQKNFKLTPGYFFETSVAQFKDEYCLAVDGTLYKHQLNAPDPFPLEELVATLPTNKLAEALSAALLWLLKAKQQPSAAQEPEQAVAQRAAAVPATGPAKPRRVFNLPFGLGGRKSSGEAATEETSVLSNQPETGDKRAPETGGGGLTSADVSAARPPATMTSEGAATTETLVQPKPDPENGGREKTDLHLEKTTS